jgi:fumarate hydratase class II
MRLSMKYRTENDTLGEVQVPSEAYYGAQTQRAVENFKVSSLKLQPAFVRAQAIIKRAAAMANTASGRLDKEIGRALISAADEIIAGKFADQFVVDAFQAGAGTSQNMNVNEVMANRAVEILGGQRGDHKMVHPNDHANMSQSTNDTIHVAIHISSYTEIKERLLPAVGNLEKELSKKVVAFEDVLKSGRTHLQDAVPISLGQEFGAYAAMMRNGQRRLETAADALLEIGIGGTAVGTGMNTDPNYIKNSIDEINRQTGYKFRTASNMFEAMENLDAVVEVAGALRVLVTSLIKIADDFRLLSSGPQTGLGEIKLPAVQPGSSIMPGKVNPVMAEMLNMVCFHALGCDTTISRAAQAGQLELNVMMPIVAYNILHEIEILTGGINSFTQRCVVDLVADEEQCRYYAERSPSLATALSPYIGYEKAAALAKEALEKNIPVRELAISKKIMDIDKLREIMDIKKMIKNPSEERDKQE